MAKRMLLEKDEYLKILLYGQPGSTKTRTACTAALDPRMSPVLMLEQGGNPLSIREYEKLPDIIHIEKLEEYNPFYEWLAAGQPPDAPIVKLFDLKPPYKTVIIDSITEVQRYSFNIVTGNTKAGPGTIPASTEIQHFNKVLGQMVTFARLFFGLPNMHVILTSLEREDRDEATGVIMYKPLLWGQSGGEVAGYAYLVGRLVHRARLAGKELRLVEDAISEKTISVALFQPTGKYVAKDQYGCMGAYMADPSMTKLLNLLVGPPA